MGETEIATSGTQRRRGNSDTMFDPTVTLGAILNAGIIFVGFVVAFTRIGGRLDLLAQHMGMVEKSLEAKGDLDRRIATVEERLTNHVNMLTLIQKDVHDLRRGDGWIRSSRRTIDGEYSG